LEIYNWGQRRLEIDLEVGQGPAWTVEPVEREFLDGTINDEW
jgi:hypothetical protein